MERHHGFAGTENFADYKFASSEAPDTNETKKNPTAVILEQNHLLQETEEGPAIDKAGLITKLHSPSKDGARLPISRLELVNFLHDLGDGFDTANPNELKKILELPTSNEDVLAGYSQREKQSLVSLTDILPVNYDKENAYIELPDHTRVKLSKLLTIGQLSEQGAEYNKILSEQENKKRTTVLRRLYAEEIISQDPASGQLILDKEKLNAQFSQNLQRKHSMTDAKRNLLFTLSGLTGSEKNSSEEKEFLPLPADVKSMVSADFAKRNEESLLTAWDEAVRPYASWNNLIKLESGERVNRAELALAANLKKFGASRVGGELYIKDPETKQKQKFNIRKFLKLAGLTDMKVTEKNENNDRQSVSITYQPIKFLHQYLPNLLKEGVLVDSDFRTLSNSDTVQTYRSHDRKVTPTSPNVGFITKGGRFVNYYIGRNKMVGLDQRLSKETPTTVQLLDQKTAGIFQNKAGQEVLVGAFPLLTAEESEQSYEAIASRKREKGNQAMTSADLTVGATEMEKRVFKYNIGDFVPQRADETVIQYQERLNKVQDVKTVRDTLTNFFEGSNIGFHNLPWSEQLVLSGIILEQKNPEVIKSFAHNFGAEGLRVIATADYESNLVEKVLKVSQEDPEYFRQLAKAYSHFADNISQVKELMQSNIDPSQTRLPVELQEAFLRRGKDLMLATDFVDGAADKSEHVQVIEALNLITEVITGLFSKNSSYEFTVESSNGNSQILGVTGPDGYQYRLKLFVRPETNTEGQARINFELDFNTEHPNAQLQELFRQTMQTTQKNKPKQLSSLRVAIDLEDHSGEQELSLDIGRSEHQSDTLVRSGDKLGQLLSKVSGAGSHNQDSFSKTYAPYFKELATSFSRALAEQVKTIANQK